MYVEVIVVFIVGIVVGYLVSANKKSNNCHNTTPCNHTHTHNNNTTTSSRTTTPQSSVTLQPHHLSLFGNVPAPPMFIDWQWVRSNYAIAQVSDGGLMYMNCGGLGPSTYAALDTLSNTMYQLQRTCDTGHSRFAAARPIVAKFVGADVSEVAFTRNATEGSSMIAAGLYLKNGDEVIIGTHTHPGGLFPWLGLAKEFGVVVKFFEPSSVSSAENVARVKALISTKTKVIQIDYITAPTGIVMPVKEIGLLAAQHPSVWYHVDAAQALGVLPINFHDVACDSLAACCHKWLGAPVGTGILVIKQSKLNMVIPTETGAYSANTYTEVPPDIIFVPNAERYEPGTRDASSVASIPVAIQFLDSIGMQQVALRGKELASYLRRQLQGHIAGVTILTPQDQSMYNSIITFKVQQVTYTELFNFLLSNYRLRLRPVSECGLNALRASTHIFNFESECDMVVKGTLDAIQTKQTIGAELFNSMYGGGMETHQ